MLINHTLCQIEEHMIHRLCNMSSHERETTLYHRIYHHRKQFVQTYEICICSYIYKLDTMPEMQSISSEVRIDISSSVSREIRHVVLATITGTIGTTINESINYNWIEELQFVDVIFGYHIFKSGSLILQWRKGISIAVPAMANRQDIVLQWIHHIASFWYALLQYTSFLNRKYG